MTTLLIVGGVLLYAFIGAVVGRAVHIGEIRENGYDAYEGMSVAAGIFWPLVVAFTVVARGLTVVAVVMLPTVDKIAEKFIPVPPEQETEANQLLRSPRT